jgi:hypothetical protein
MRTILMTAALLVLGSLAGCCHRHSHGICDCEYDDYCLSRSPWVRGNVMVTPPPAAGEKVPPPAKLPDVKKRDL